MKKFTAFLLAVVIMLIPVNFTSAEQNNETRRILPVRVTGQIVETTDTSITIESVHNGETIILHLPERPVIVDAISGQPAVLNDRIDNDMVAYYGPLVMDSIPLQSTAIVVVINIPQGSFMTPFYHVVEAVERNADEVKVTVDNGSLIVTINEDTDIFPYLTRNIVTKDMIDVGAELLMWYPIVALSHPGQATAQKVLFLGQSDKPLVQRTKMILQIGNGIALVDKKEVHLDAEPLISNNYTMLPLRFIADHFGCDIEWNDATKTVSISFKTTETVEMTLQIGNNKAIVNGEEAVLDAPPIIVNGRTMLPIRFIAENFGLDVSWDETERTVTIMK